MSIPTQKDADQTLRYAFDDATNSIRVAGTFIGTNSASGPTGAPPPAQATQVAGVDNSGNLHALQTDASGNLLVAPSTTGAPSHVVVDSSALPTGAATEATLSSVNTSQGFTNLILTNGSQETQIVGTVPLPTGASTSALQTSGNASLTSLNSRLAGAFVPTAFDENVITYVGATTQIDTVVYKLAGVTVKTLTMSYDGSNRLTDVVAT